MTVRFNKDAWIKNALVKGYLRVVRDGTIWRCTKADENGQLLADDYREVVVQIHKPTGRAYFNMTWRGITKSVLVNRVVALRYLPNPDNLPQVNHLDGDKENNAVWNLEWASASQNERHAHRTGLKTGRGSSNANAKLSADQVLAIRASQASSDELAKTYGVSRSTIVNIQQRRTWRHV